MRALRENRKVFVMENEKTEIISAKYITEQTNHMEYQPGMDNIGSEVQDEVISRMNAYDADAYTAADVLRALRKDVLSPEDFGALLSPAALPFLEQMAQRAQPKRASISATRCRCSRRCISPITAKITAFTAVSTVITRFAVPSWIWTRSSRS